MVKTIKSLYSRIFEEKYYKKVLFIYVFILVITVIMFTWYVSQNTEINLLQQFKNQNRQVMNLMLNLAESKKENARDIILKMYGDENFSQDVFKLLEEKDDSFLFDDALRKNYFVNTLSSIINVDRDIRAIKFYKNDSGSLYEYVREAASLQKVKFSKEYDYLKPVNYAFSVVPVHQSSYLINGLKINVYGFASSILYPWGGVGGKLLIEYDAKAFENTFALYTKNVKGYIILLKSNGEVIFDSSKKYYNRKYPYFNVLKSPDILVKTEEESFVDIVKSDREEFICASIIPKSDLYENINVLKNTTFIISIFSLIFLFILFYMAAGLFSKRMQTVIKAMKTVGSSNLSYRIEINNSKDEIGQIAMHFNRMCDNLQEYINKSYIYELKQKNAELNMLQSQVNPHFLYNSLEVIRSRAVNDGNVEIGEMIHALAAMFRTLIKGEMLIEIKDEMEHSRMYLNIFNMRYKDYFKMVIDIDDNILHFGIIKNILQPIFENYIVHGFNPAKNDNCISIKAYLKEEDIYIEISDNGKGMEKEKLESIKKRIHEPDINLNDNIGLDNVNERIKILFGNEYGLDISSAQGKGTIVTVKIPARAKEKIEHSMYFPKKTF